MACSNSTAEKRISDLFLTFNLPPNKEYAQQLKELLIKYDDNVYEEALKIFMLEIYPKSLPNLGMIKRHLENALNQKRQNDKLIEFKKEFMNDNDKAEWRQFIKTILSSWKKISKYEIDMDSYHQNMADFFDNQKDYIARDSHKKLIGVKNG